jgi:hypothetical protein
LDSKEIGTMTTHVACPGCKEELEINPEDIGREVECAECGRAFRVPATTKGNSMTTPASAKRGEHQIAIVVSQIVSAIGWITCLVAAIIVLGAFANAGRMGALALAPAWGVFIGGLVLIIAGQTSRSVLYIESIARAILQEIQTAEEETRKPEGSATSNQTHRRNVISTERSVLGDQDRTLFEAVWAGDLKRVEELLAHGANPQAKDESGYTPGDHARGRGFNDIQRLLDGA